MLVHKKKKKKRAYGSRGILNRYEYGYFLKITLISTNTNLTFSTAIDMKTKPTMCVYIEPNSFYNGDSPVIQPDSIPSKCEVILFYHIIINNASRILVANTGNDD